MLVAALGALFFQTFLGLISSGPESAKIVLLVEEGEGWITRLLAELSKCEKRAVAGEKCDFSVHAVRYREKSNLKAEVTQALTSIGASNVIVLAGVTGEFAVAVRGEHPGLQILVDSYHDPRRMCLARSLERPGFGVSGIFGVPEVGDRLIELLVRAYPAVQHVVVLVDEDALGQLPCGTSRPVSSMEAMSSCRKSRWLSSEDAAVHIFSEPFFESARIHGRRISFFQVCRGRSIVDAVSELGRSDIGIVVPARDSFYLRRGELVNAINELHVPVIYQGRVFVKSGGLMALTPKLGDPMGSLALMVQQAATGRPVSDIPIEQPLQNEVIFNRITARNLDTPPRVEFLKVVDEFYAASRR